MKKRSGIAIVAAAMAAGPAWAEPIGAMPDDGTFMPIDFRAFHNAPMSLLGSNYPTGAITLGEVPFAIPKRVTNNIWISDPTFRSNDPVEVEFPINLFGVDDFHVLVNSFWGLNGQSHVAFEFDLVLDGGGPRLDDEPDETYRFELVGGEHIREYIQSSHTNTITSPLTQQVYLSDNGQRRLDMLSLDLPESFRNGTLTKMRVIDTGGVGIHRTAIGGMTVLLNPIPAPGSLTLLAFGGVLATRRRR
ncbi:MAG: hypothetical protein ACF8SC_03750 [Phycisphaerales bacterium JB037]